MESAGAAAHPDLLETQVIILLPGDPIPVVIADGNIRKTQLLAPQHENPPAPAAINRRILGAIPLNRQRLHRRVLHVVAADDRINAHHHGVPVAAIVKLQRLADPQAVPVAVGERGDGADESAGNVVVDVYAHSRPEFLRRRQRHVTVPESNIGRQRRGHRGRLPQHGLLPGPPDGHLRPQVQRVVHDPFPRPHQYRPSAHPRAVIHRRLQRDIVLPPDIHPSSLPHANRQLIRVALHPASHAHTYAPCVRSRRGECFAGRIREISARGRHKRDNCNLIRPSAPIPLPLNVLLPPVVQLFRRVTFRLGAATRDNSARIILVTFPPCALSTRPSSGWRTGCGRQVGIRRAG